MPPKARRTNPSKSANTNKTVTCKTNLHWVQQDDHPIPVDDDQGGTQKVGPSCRNRNHHSISALQVTDDASHADAQAMMAKVTELEDQNCKLLLSKSTSQTSHFILLTIQSPRKRCHMWVIKVTQ